MIETKPANKIDQIIIREWGGLKCSFELCGDIGYFHFQDLKDVKWLVGEKYEGLVVKITEMEEMRSQYSYASPQAFYVFTVLAILAAQKLGLHNQKLSFAFGMGYGFIRTGVPSDNMLEYEQILFYNKFFPLGHARNPGWEFNPCLVKRKLRVVFDKFIDWQNNPQLYKKDFARSQNMEEN